MATDSWKWKSKDGSASGLLYEPGNWGDMLKFAWLIATADFVKAEISGQLRYFDPFAGQAGYPLGRSTLARFRQAGTGNLERLRPWVETNVWPSAALLMRSMFDSDVTVFDTDPGRLASWEDINVTIAKAESGYHAATERNAHDDTLWLIDPYDFLAEWRDALPLIMDKSRQVPVLLYVYNRSAGKPEAFAEYRAFRNRLVDSLGENKLCRGRVASDSFLPRAHHEMFLFPNPALAASASYPRLVKELEQASITIANAVEHSGRFEAM